MRRWYPLVVLLDDSTIRRTGEPFLLDAAWQQSGHAIQMLAAQGFMALYPREPIIQDVVETAEEGARVREYIESAVAKLDGQGLIDPKRISLSCWDRSFDSSRRVIAPPVAASIRRAAAESMRSSNTPTTTQGVSAVSEARESRLNWRVIFLVINE